MGGTESVCTSCGAVPPRPEARFCDACGAPLAGREIRAELKQVTVLFADVVRSMDLAAAVGAERMREIMAELLERCAAVVRRYGGTMDKFTGDGVMAVFGAPVALEDHAIRACLAALDIQREARSVAAHTERLDDAELQVRIGLNSGEVVVGEIGSGPFGYTAIGEQVGMAQRMEAAAPPAGVMLSESTARLVEEAMELGEPESVRIKGVDAAVPARRLRGAGARRPPGRSAAGKLVGRGWEIAAVEAILDRSIGSHGSVVSVVGPPGIGKSRVVAEATALADDRAVPVFSTFCESHANEIPFRAVSRLLRAAYGVDEGGDAAARHQVRSRVPGASAEDVALLEDLLGIAEPGAPAPQIDADARRRRLTALVNASALAASTPALYVIEDAHWIDSVSESLIADLLAVIPQTHFMVLITHRPEYRGPLSRTPGAQVITLAPLDDSESSTLVAGLLGPDESVAGLSGVVAERAAGNPFFTQEIVRDLADRGVLVGARGAYRCADPTTEVAVPATLRAAIAARIDRLDGAAKRTLNAAAVIGTRFDTELLGALVDDCALGELMSAELIDQVVFTPRAEFAFHHPLIRAVAYESQLKADRAAWHRRLAVAIEEQDPAAADENAALVAEHLEAAGDLAAAYAWHMRAATWLTSRHVAAAHASLRKAQQVADRLPLDHPQRTGMRIAARTLLAGGAWRVGGSGAEVRFDELRELCEAVGDKRSLAIGMTGLVMKHTLSAHYREASALAGEHSRLLDAIDDPDLTVGLSFAACAAKYQALEPREVLRLAQRVIDLAGGRPGRGNMFFGSPLAVAMMFRGRARCSLGMPGWKDDFADAIAMARQADTMTLGLVVFYIYVVGIPYGIVQPDSTVLDVVAELLDKAERSGDDITLTAARGARGIALAYREPPECDAGMALLAEVRDDIVRERFSRSMLPYIDIELARARARVGDAEGAVALVRPYLTIDPEVMTVHALAVDIVAGVLLGGARRDAVDVEQAIADLTAYAARTDLVVYKLLSLRLHAVLARARGDESAHRDCVARYRAMAQSLGFDAHVAMATAMATAG